MSTIAKMEKQELVHVSLDAPNALSQTLEFLKQASSSKDFDIEKFDRLLQMQERLLLKQSESEFNEAMQRVQAEVPRILRDAVNPSTNSKYTRLESLLKIIVPIYTVAGFSMSFGTSDCPIQNHYRITCKVAHKGSSGSFTRDYQCDIPADTTGMKGTMNKTATHGFGSTMSYGRRYLTLLIFNIALVNEDDDSKGQQKPSASGRVVTAATRTRFFEVCKPWREKLHAMAIDLSWVMPDEGLDKLPDAHIPITRIELEKLQKDAEAHQ